MKRKMEAKMKRSSTCHHPGHQNSLLIEKNSLMDAKMEKRLSSTRNAKLIYTQNARLWMANSRVRLMVWSNVWQSTRITSALSPKRSDPTMLEGKINWSSEEDSHMSSNWLNITLLRLLLLQMQQLRTSIGKSSSRSTVSTRNFTTIIIEMMMASSWERSSLESRRIRSLRSTRIGQTTLPIVVTVSIHMLLANLLRISKFRRATTQRRFQSRRWRKSLILILLSLLLSKSERPYSTLIPRLCISTTTMKMVRSHQTKKNGSALNFLVMPRSMILMVMNKRRLKSSKREGRSTTWKWSVTSRSNSRKLELAARLSSDMNTSRISINLEILQILRKSSKEFLRNRFSKRLVKRWSLTTRRMRKLIKLSRRIT